MAALWLPGRIVILVRRIEVAAGLSIVLILTGLHMWWPGNGRSLRLEQTPMPMSGSDAGAAGVPFAIIDFFLPKSWKEVGGQAAAG